VSAPVRRDLSWWAATWFGAGALPKAPGTWGSLAALPFAWIIQTGLGPGALIAAALVVFFLGLWVSEHTARALGHSDPGQIVIDEVAAQWLVLAVVPPSWQSYLAGFLLFRLFDVLKPWPIRRIERRLGGGFGIMADDIMAAVYAAPLLFALYDFGLLS
jgi:phosphatidylglycerophosphatase A